MLFFFFVFLFFCVPDNDWPAGSYTSTLLSRAERICFKLKESDLFKDRRMSFMCVTHLRLTNLKFCILC